VDGSGESFLRAGDASSGVATTVLAISTTTGALDTKPVCLNDSLELSANAAGSLLISGNTSVSFSVSVIMIKILI
jgi:hypothetical protein